MNKRIKELYEKSRMMHKEGTQYVEEFDKEKFAELIVRGCGNFLKDTLDDHFAAKALEKHFEVE